MKKHTRFVLELGWGLGLVLTVVLTLAAARRQAVARAVCADTVRLHILANSDSLDDQLRKLTVRDAVLETMQAALRDADGKEEAVAALRAALPALDWTARRAAGGQAVAVYLTEDDFAPRDYGGFALPGGRYTALRIELGQAAGHNWFCVLYPSLCVSGAAAEYPTEEENALVFGGYEVRFALWDGIKKLAGK